MTLSVFKLDVVWMIGYFLFTIQENVETLYDKKGRPCMGADLLLRLVVSYLEEDPDINVNTLCSFKQDVNSIIKIHVQYIIELSNILISLRVH